MPLPTPIRLAKRALALATTTILLLPPPKPVISSKGTYGAHMEWCQQISKLHAIFAPYLKINRSLGVLVQI